MSKSKRLVVLHIIAGVALMLAGVIGLDRLVAEHLHSSEFKPLRYYRINLQRPPRRYPTCG
jgi:hypothetical protein